MVMLVATACDQTNPNPNPDPNLTLILTLTPTLNLNLTLSLKLTRDRSYHLTTYRLTLEGPNVPGSEGPKNI